MSFNAKEAPKSGKSFPPTDPGTYPARLLNIIDFGLQAQIYKGESKPPAREMSTTYELLDEFLKDEEGEDMLDKPRVVSESYALRNLDNDKAKSTERYYALDPNEEAKGDWAKLIGKPVLVTIIINEKAGKVYNNISGTSTMRAREVEKAPKLVNDSFVFELSDTSKESLQRYSDFPQWIKDKIGKGLEWQGSDFQIALEGFKPVAKDTKSETKKKPKPEPEVEEKEEDNGNW